MNKQQTRLGKLLPRIVLILALFCTLAVVLSSCANNGIQVKDLTDWGGNVETGAESEVESSGEGETDDGSAESGEIESTEEETQAPTTNSSLKAVSVTDDKGFLDTILSYIGKFLNLVTSIMPANSYILTLLIFAIVLEILFLPFGIKQQKNSIKQAMLRPKEMAIRKKYAGRNDQATQQKVTQEIQELYQKENFNQ